MIPYIRPIVNPLIKKLGVFTKPFFAAYDQQNLHAGVKEPHGVPGTTIWLMVG